MQGLGVGAGIGTLGLVAGVASIVGGIGAARLRPWARGAGITAGIINVLSCGCLVSTGLGVWLLVLLFNRKADTLRPSPRPLP
jgi:hypothetical protein